VISHIFVAIMAEETVLFSNLQFLDSYFRYFACAFQGNAKRNFCLFVAIKLATSSI